MAASPLPSRGPRTGRNCYAAPAFVEVPAWPLGPWAKRGGGSEVAASPLPSHGPKRGRNCDVIPALSGVPNANRGEKIRRGCLTPAFSRAQKRAEWLRHPWILGGPQHQARGENQKWLPHPCLLKGAKEGGSVT